MTQPGDLKDPRKVRGAPASGGVKLVEVVASRTILIEECGRCGKEWTCRMRHIFAPSIVSLALGVGTGPNIVYQRGKLLQSRLITITTIIKTAIII